MQKAGSYGTADACVPLQRQLEPGIVTHGCPVGMMRLRRGVG